MWNKINFKLQTSIYKNNKKNRIRKEKNGKGKGVLIKPVKISNSFFPFASTLSRLGESRKDD